MARSTGLDALPARRDTTRLLGPFWVRSYVKWVRIDLHMGSFGFVLSGQTVFSIAPVRKVGFVWDTFFRVSQSPFRRTWAPGAHTSIERTCAAIVANGATRSAQAMANRDGSGSALRFDSE